MSDDATRKLELLKMARTLVNEEYINRRAEEHNKWVALNDHTLRTTKVRAPYPAFTAYPSEDVIIAKALALYNFIAAPSPVPAVAPVPEAPEEVAIPADVNETLEESNEPEIEEFVPIEVIDPDPILESVAPPSSIDIGDIVDSANEETHLLPGWVKGWIRK